MKFFKQTLAMTSTRAKKVLSFTMAALLVISSMAVGGPFSIVANAEDAEDGIRTVIYDMQDELDEIEDGTAFVYTEYLQNSGGSPKVKNNVDDKKIVIEGRTGDHNGVDIKVESISRNSGCDYEIVVTGSILNSEGTVKIKMAESGDPYGTFNSTTASSDFELTNTFSYGNLQDCLDSNLNIRIQTESAATVSFEIYSIIITEISYQSNSVIYDMQDELDEIEDGTAFVYTEYLQNSGGSPKVKDNVDGKKIVIEDRTGDHNGVDIKVESISRNSGCDYEIVVTGSILNSEGTVKIKMAESGDPYGTFNSTTASSDFELTNTFSYGNLQDCLDSNLNIRIQTESAATVSFEIHSIIITEINHGVVPTTETVTVKVGGAESPWSDYAEDTHELTLGGESAEFTLTRGFDDLAALTAHSNGSGNLRIHTADPAKNDYIIDDLTITVDGDTRYDMQTDSKVVVGTSLASDTLAASGTIKTAVVANQTKKSISVTERVAQWAGVVIKYDVLETLIGVDGINIVITITGRVIPSPIPDAIPEGAETWLEVESLKEIYTDYFKIGNIISPGNTAGKADHAETIEGFKHHFDVVTAENDMKPNAYGNTANTYDFAKADKIVDWADENDLFVQGHTLAWHSQSATWLNVGLNRGEAKANLEEFIQEVAGRYENEFPGIVYGWDVVNEVHLQRSTDWKANLRTGNDGGDSSPWYAAYQNGANIAEGESGADYIYDAFKFARQYAPSATLYYNDFNDDHATKSTAIANMVIDINEQWTQDDDYDGRNLIEGVGMQSHYSTTTSVKNVEASINRFIDAGVKVSITELDITTTDKTPAGYIKQAQVYAQLFQIYKEYSEDIERVTFWGLKDDLSWRSNGNPLIFDKNFIAKEAYYAVADPDTYLLEHPLDVVDVKPKTSIAVKGTPSMTSGVIDSIWDKTVSLNADRFVEGSKAYPNFATGEFKVLWDENNIYVLGIVTDEELAATASGAYLHDCVEVFFSPSNNKTGPKVTGDGHHRVNYKNAKSEDSRDGLESVAWTTETGYVVKMKIPFNDPNLTPAIGTEIGFDCQVNDEGRDSNGTRNSVSVWSDISNGHAYEGTDAWGTLVLVEDINAKILVEDTAVGKAASGKPSGGDVEARMNSTDWANVEKLPVYKWTTNNTNNIFGTSRATGTAQVKWDETKLYVRVEVKDNDLNTAHTNSYQKDCVEVYITETGSNGGQSRLTYSGVKEGPVASGGEVSVKDIAGGYIAYLEIPHKLTEPVLGDIVKFDIQISDATTPANDRTGITTWSDWTANGYGSSDNFGKLILAEAKEENTGGNGGNTGGDNSNNSPTPPTVPENVLENFEKKTEDGETAVIIDKKGEELDFSKTIVTETIKVVADDVVIKNITSDHNVVLEGKNIVIENATLEKDLQISGRGATLTDAVVKGDVALTGALTEVKDTTVNGKFVISGNKSIVENVTIKNDFVIGKELKNGQINVKDSKITGNVTINGGGKNGVTFTDTTANTVSINKKADAGTQQARLVLEGTSKVGNVKLLSKSVIESKGNKGSIANITVAKRADKSTVTLTKADSVSKFTFNKGAAIKVKAGSGTLTLKSTDKKIVAVSKTGTMRAYKKGDAKVSITLKNNKAVSTKVNVK